MLTPARPAVPPVVRVRILAPHQPANVPHPEPRPRPPTAPGVSVEHFLREHSRAFRLVNRGR